MIFSKLQSILGWAAAGLLALALTACEKDTLLDVPPPGVGPDGKLRLQLFTDQGGFTAPVTRGIEDAGPDATWVFVFTKAADATDYTFSEVAQAETTDGKTFVKLKSTTISTKLLIIANAPETFYTGTETKTWTKDNLEAVLKPVPTDPGKTLAQADDLLLAALLANPQPELPYFHEWDTSVERPIPMSVVTPAYATGIKSIPSIGTDTESGKIKLKRMVAKVDVKMGVSGYSYGYGLVGAPRTGSIFSESNSNLFVTTGGTTEYLKTESGKKETIAAKYFYYNSELNEWREDPMPMYVYESQSEGLSVIVKIQSYMISNAPVYYYRVAFLDANGTRLNVERNKYYTITVTSVDGPGYATIEEAIAAPVANLKYILHVVDLNSHDIVSNGQYFLSTSNSELNLFNDQETVSVPGFTLTTDALTGYFDPTALAAGQVATLKITKGSGFTISPTTVNLAASASAPAVTDVQVNLTGAFKFYSPSNLYDEDPSNDGDGIGEVTVKLGNLTKVLKIYRYNSMSYTGWHMLPGSDYISGEIKSRGDGDWLTLGMKQGQTTDKFVLGEPSYLTMRSPGNMYINDGQQGHGSIRTGAEFYLTRKGANGEGRAKFLVSQSVLNDQLPINTEMVHAYVGAYWRATETGERLIRIPYDTKGEDSWTATVVRGEDWITLDTRQASFQTFPPTDMNAENFQITDGSNVVGGILPPNSNNTIYFRVGLKSQLPAEKAPARYGLILLSYSNNTKHHRIYVRQGEGDDFLYADRTYSRKVSPYNLTAQTFLDQIEAEKSGADMLDATAYEDIDKTGGEFTFTQFPSQAGAHFQGYYLADGYRLPLEKQYKRRAFHPLLPHLPTDSYDYTRQASPIYWDHLPLDEYKLCPTGYHRPNDGYTDRAQPTSNGQFHANPELSEMQNSLSFRNDGMNGSSDGLAWGYYADGFFDRRTIRDNTTVDANKTSVAYIGGLFFNEATYHSIFFPAAGQRVLYQDYSGRDEIGGGGDYGQYLSTSGYEISGWSDMAMWTMYVIRRPDIWGGHTSQNALGYARLYAVSIRCVAD